MVPAEPIQGSLRELRGVSLTWVLREWELTANGELLRKKQDHEDSRYPLSAGCTVSDVEVIEVSETSLGAPGAPASETTIRRLYCFMIAWPAESKRLRRPSKRQLEADSSSEEEGAMLDEDEADEDDENAVRVAATKKKSLLQRPFAPKNACAVQQRKTGKGLVSIGAVGVLVGLGGMAVGIPTLGVGVVPYFLGCGVALTGGGGALTRRGKNEKRLVLASKSRKAAYKWRDAIAAVVAGSSASTAKELDPPPSSPRGAEAFGRGDPWRFAYTSDGRTLRLGGDHHDPEIETAFRRGVFIKKKRVGPGTAVSARVSVAATPLRAFVAILKGERPLSRAGIVDKLCQLQVVDDRNDVVVLTLGPLAPSLNGDSRRSALLKAVWLTARALLALCFAFATRLVGKREASPPSSPSAVRKDLARAAWLVWAAVADAAQALVLTHPGRLANYLYRATHFASREIRLDRTWKVTDSGIYVAELNSATDSSLWAHVSVAPLKAKMGASVSVRLDLALPWPLVRIQDHDSASLRDELRDAVAALYADELALAIVDLRDGLSDDLDLPADDGVDTDISMSNCRRTHSDPYPDRRRRPATVQPPHTFEDRMHSCQANIEAAEAAVSRASTPAERRDKTLDLQRHLARFRDIKEAGCSGNLPDSDGEDDDDEQRRAAVADDYVFAEHLEREQQSVDANFVPVSLPSFDEAKGVDDGFQEEITYIRPSEHMRRLTHELQLDKTPDGSRRPGTLTGYRAPTATTTHGSSFFEWTTTLLVIVLVSIFTVWFTG